MEQHNRASTNSDYAHHTLSLPEASTSINQGVHLPAPVYYEMVPQYHLLQHPAVSNFYFPFEISSSGVYSSVCGTVGVPTDRYGTNNYFMRHPDGASTMDQTSLALPKYGLLVTNHFTTGNYIGQPFRPVGSRWFDHQFINSGEANGSARSQMPTGPYVHENYLNPIGYINPMGTPSMLQHRNRGLGSARIRSHRNDAGRYQEMRMDVDSMSYEDLLALRESIGKVNVGASEETIKSRLKIKTYSNSPADSLDQEPPECCSICQEEYKDGDEIGILNCKHQYHKDCLMQWLRLKNVCPLCKCDALAPSEEDKDMND